MWFLISFLWAAASVIVIAPLVNEIEMLETQSQRVFSYIILVFIAPAVLAVEYGMEALEKMGLDMENNDDKDLWEQGYGGTGKLLGRWNSVLIIKNKNKNKIIPK